MPPQPNGRPLAEDVVTVGDTPGSPDRTIPARPGKTITVRADLRDEYVSGGTAGSGQWYLNYAKTWPWHIDDITRDFGDDLYERMAMDPQVRANVNLLKASIVEDGLQLAPAVDDRDQDGYALATAMCDAATLMFDRLDTAIDDVLWDMLDAIAVGNKVAEQVYRMDDGPDGRPMLMLAALKVKPRHATAFVVDAFMNVLGLTARIPGDPAPVQAGMYVDPAAIPNLLPRSKFAVFSFRQKEGDPRGVSLLRSAYTPWNFKQQIYREWLRYLTQFASPSLIGYTDPLSETQPQTDSLGNVLTDPVSGLPLPGTSPETAMANALAGFRNGSVVALKGGSKVDVIHSQGDGQAFTLAVDEADRQITKAILTQTLASEEGKHQARAAALVHQDILDTLVRQGKWPVERMLRRDILRPWALYNYGPKALGLLPVPTLGRTEETNVQSLMTAVSQLQAAGYFQPSQYQGLDALLNVPVRTSDEVATKEGLAQSALTAAQSPPPAPAPPQPAQGDQSSQQGGADGDQPGRARQAA